MPVSLTTLTGPIYMPNGATPVGGRVSFELSSWDREEGEALIVSGPIYSNIDENGQFSVELFTTTEGTNTVNYKMYVLWEDSELSQSYVNDVYVSSPVPHYTKKYIGSFALAGAGPFQVSDLNIVSELELNSFDVLLECQAYSLVAGASVDLAEAYAQTPEDTEVPGGAGYSALHYAAKTAADRVQTGLDRTGAENARDAALLSRGVFASTALGLSNGVAAVTVTAAGNGGTNGVFALAFSGGAGTGAAGSFTVSGGAVVSVEITHPGTGYTSAPSVSFAASAGLTGATATVAIAPRNPVGTFFSVPATGYDSLILYRVDAGPVAVEVARYPSSAAVLNAGFGSGNLLSVLSTVGRQVNNGAALSGSFGISFPIGVVGNSSVFQPRYLFTAAGRVGQIIEVRLGFDQSSTFTRAFLSPAMNVITAANPSGISRTSTVTNSVVGTRRVVTFRYTLQGDETAFQPILVTTTGAATAAAESLTLTDYVLNYVTSSSDVLSASDQVLRDNLTRLVRAGVDQTYLFSLGNSLSDLTWIGQLFNGATRSYYTITIPNGSTGQTTLNHWRLAFSGAGRTGQRLRIRLGYTLSATFTRTFPNMTFQVATAGSPNGVSRIAAVNTVSTAGTRRVHTLEYVLQGDETAIMPFLQLNSTTPTASNETITITDFVVEFLTAVGDVLNTQDEALLVREGAARNRAWEPAAAYNNSPAATQQVARTVAPSGGDFTTPNAALAGISDAQPWNRYRITVEPGIYTGGEFFDEDYVDFQGRNAAECRFRLFQADGTSSANISLFSTMYMLRNSRLDGLTIECKNARYAIHLESGNGAPNRLQEIINCEVLHFGNDDAPANTWVAQYAVGSGLSSGQHVRVRGGRFWGKNTGAFYYHTNIDYAHPSIVDIEGAELSTDAANGNALVAVAMGSFVKDRCRLVASVIGGDIRYLTTPWLQTPLNKQPANHAEIDMFGAGNSPAVFRITDFGRALMIESATTGSGSSVVVSGDAVPLIFGDGATARTFGRSGSPGFAAQVWGWGDVSDVAVGPAQNVQITALGKRLGDCTSVNRTLTVTIDGGSPITVTFNQNYTAQSNATILAAINSALGAAATASLFAPGERYRPRFADEEIAALNTSGTGILMGSVLAFDGSHRSVRLMTSADAATLFAGVAWEDIAAGTSGRIKSGGYLPITDILRADAATVTFGTTFSISASTPGSVVVGGSQGLLTAVRADAVQVR